MHMISFMPLSSTQVPGVRPLPSHLSFIFFYFNFFRAVSSSQQNRAGSPELSQTRPTAPMLDDPHGCGPSVSLRHPHWHAIVPPSPSLTSELTRSWGCTFYGLGRMYNNNNICLLLWYRPEKFHCLASFSHKKRKVRRVKRFSVDPAFGQGYSPPAIQPLGDLAFPSRFALSSYKQVKPFFLVIVSSS